MTSFQAPFTVKSPNSDDVLFTVSASGVVSKNPIEVPGITFTSASVIGNLTVGGSLAVTGSANVTDDMNIAGTLTVDGSASVAGPIRNGGTYFTPFVINLPVSAAGMVVTAAGLPGANHAVIGGRFLCETSASGMTGGIDIRVGDVANSNRFGTVAGVSAAGEYAFVLGSAAASAGTRFIVDATVQSSGGNLEAFSGRLFLTVVPVS